MKQLEAKEIFDLRGVPCPQNSAKALIKLGGMDKDEILEIIIDDGEPYENVPLSIEEDSDFKIEQIFKTDDNSWHLLVRVLN
jgi:TusA-related sulfurtransferase